MRWRNITPDNTEFVILCFEGPDRYSRAGGLGVRVEHMSATLAAAGFRTHLFFVGDPNAPGEEVRCGGRLILHRWCQWISRYHPDGVYQGENEKLYDFNQSIPGFVRDRIVKPIVARGNLAVILGEEWHTAEAMCLLSDALHNDGIRDRVVMFWNANNTFSFDRIDWPRLNGATTITTVSRYMKHIMWRMGLNPLVVPNGIPKSLLAKIEDKASDRVRNALKADLVLCKVARWDPDKRWSTAVEATAKLKGMGLRTTLVARGGSESYGREVIASARALGLSVKVAEVRSFSRYGYLRALTESTPADVIDVRSPLPQEFLRVIYRACDGVLSNSGHEPFGLVGLEAMAAGGVAFIGCTGEDYAIPFVNSFVLETPDPMEIVDYVMYLRDYPEESARIRSAARRTARNFTWDAAARNLISKLENQARIQGIVLGKAKPAPPPVLEMAEQTPAAVRVAPDEELAKPTVHWRVIELVGRRSTDEQRNDVDRGGRSHGEDTERGCREAADRSA